MDRWYLAIELDRQVGNARWLQEFEEWLELNIRATTAQQKPETIVAGAVRIRTAQLLLEEIKAYAKVYGVLPAVLDVGEYSVYTVDYFTAPQQQQLMYLCEVAGIQTRSF